MHCPACVILQAWLAGRIWRSCLGIVGRFSGTCRQMVTQFSGIALLDVTGLSKQTVDVYRRGQAFMQRLVDQHGIEGRDRPLAFPSAAPLWSQTDSKEGYEAWESNYEAKATKPWRRLRTLRCGIATRSGGPCRRRRTEPGRPSA